MVFWEFDALTELFEKSDVSVLYVTVLTFTYDDLDEVLEFIAYDDVNEYELLELIGTLFAFIEYEAVPLFEE